MEVSDTIAAISTPLGEGGIAVIRVSGSESVKVADGIFAYRKALTEVPSHTVHYGHIQDPATGRNIEEVLVTVMRAPRSFTREDVVEISCHGGIIAVKKVLDLLLQAGARLAEPGEFTKRAFLNGRIDLTQAEAVMDLIRSKSDKAYENALKQAQGRLSTEIAEIREQLITLMAHIEVNIDYPEHDVEDMTNAYILEQCRLALQGVVRLLETADQGKVLREGIVTAIVGRPNVGKSSLLNLLAKENRAIVTDIPGTTRDVIEEYVTMKGIPLKLLDTAGLRETSDVVERIGVERSKNALSEADLILFVLNQHEELHVEERDLLKQLAGRQTIVVINKIDLSTKLDLNWVQSLVPEEQIVKMSVRDGKGLNMLEQAVTRMFFSGRLEAADLTYVSNVRHIHLLKQAKSALEDSIRAAEQRVPIDMIQIDISAAWERLGEVIGDSVGESLLDQIFSKFCLGK